MNSYTVSYSRIENCVPQSKKQGGYNMSRANKDRRQAVLELWINNPFATYKEIADAAGIDVTTFRAWRNDAAFMEEYHTRTAARFREMEARAMAKLDNLVSDGEWQAVKYVLDGNGYKPTDKVEVQQTTINVSVEDD